MLLWLNGSKNPCRRVQAVNTAGKHSWLWMWMFKNHMPMRCAFHTNVISASTISHETLLKPPVRSFIIRSNLASCLFLAVETVVYLCMCVHNPYHIAALMIFMTHSLMHWHTLTSGAPRSPIFPSSKPEDTQCIHTLYIWCQWHS